MSPSLAVPEYEVHEVISLDPTTTALVVVDMQNDFVKDGGTLQVDDAEATLPAIASLVGAARAAGLPVVFSQDTHGPHDDAGDERALATLLG